MGNTPDKGSEFSREQAINAASIISTNHINFQRKRYISRGTPMAIQLNVTESITTQPITVIVQGADNDAFTTNLVSETIKIFPITTVAGKPDSSYAHWMSPDSQVYNRKYLRLRYTKPAAAGAGKITSGITAYVPAGGYVAHPAGYTVEGHIT